MTSIKMAAFKGNYAYKEAVIEGLIRRKNQMKQGTRFHWDPKENCGSAVGVTLADFSDTQWNNLSVSQTCTLYETYFGIPEWVASFEHEFFNKCSNEDRAKEFAIDIIRAIPVGFDRWEEVGFKMCKYIYNETKNEHLSFYLGQMIDVRNVMNHALQSVEDMAFDDTIMEVFLSAIRNEAKLATPTNQG